MSQEVVSLTKAKQNLGTVGWRERLALTEESAASAPGRPGRTPPPPLLVLGAESQARGATPPGLPAQTDSDERRAHTDRNPQAHSVPDEATCPFQNISCHTQRRVLIC